LRGQGGTFEFKNGRGVSLFAPSADAAAPSSARPPALSLTLPNGAVQGVLRDADSDVAGVALTINGDLAAVVEWHPEQGAIVLYTYRSPTPTPTENR
jgi:hypothetical protein